MTQLLVFREHLQKFYQKNAFFLNPLCRFFIGFIIFFSINRLIGYHPVLNHRYIEAILALTSILMSGEVLLFFSAVFIVVHIFYVSNLLAVAVALLFAVLYFAYLKFVPEHAYLIMAFPIAFSLNLVCALPVLLGLLTGPVFVLPIICGVSVYYLLRTITSVLSTSTDASINLYQTVMQQFIENEEMYLFILVFSLVSLVVYLLRTRRWDFSFEISILTGGAANVIAILLLNYYFNSNINILLFLLGSVLSLGLVWGLYFFRMPLNYAGVENLQFEDDEYYYYVRAVPKMNIAVPRKSVKRFNAKRSNDVSKTKQKEEQGADHENMM